MSGMTTESLLNIVTIMGFVILFGIVASFIGMLAVSPDAIADPQNASFITKLFLSMRMMFIPAG